MLTPEDEKVVRRYVTTATFERGALYAEHGAVRRQIWSPDRRRVIGEVKGTDRANYVVTVLLGRSASQRLTSFSSTCTCPFAVNCKHGVALLLAPGAGESVDFKSPPTKSPRLRLLPTIGPAESSPRKPQWEDQLERALDSADDDAEPVENALALQFDLVELTRWRTLNVRPVIRGASGKWIKTGISWSSLDYFHYRRGPIEPTKEQIAVLKEILSLSRLADGSNRYAYVDDDIRFESIPSRRVWDLLDEARQLGVSLIDASRLHQEVTLEAGSFEASIDVTQAETGLVVSPRIASQDRRVVMDRAVLLGVPTHGVAWLDEATPGELTNAKLHLAPLASTLSDSRRGQLLMSNVEVPARDQRRFLESYVPRMRRSFAVTSSDESVSLPKPLAPTLELQIHCGPGHRCVVNWCRVLEGGAWLETLWSPSAPSSNEESFTEIVASVTALAAEFPQLLEPTSAGLRLAARCVLVDIDAVRLLSEFLPEVTRISGVAAELTGEMREYREANVAPVVSLRESQGTDGDWFDLTVEVTVGNEVVPFRDLFVALASGQTHLILPTGTYFSLDNAQLRELAQTINEARTMYDTPRGELRLSRFQASLFDDFARLGVITQQAEQWVRSVSSLAIVTERTEYVVPETLHAKLRSYQLVGFNWLVFLYENSLGGVLADDMGLGKTVQALALICHVKEREEKRRPFLVVAPTSVVGNWASECRKFAPGLTVATVSETSKRRSASISDLAEHADVVITSYTLLRLDIEEYKAVNWAGLFLDEAQFVKNRSALSYQHAKSLNVPFKIAMTGTPIENSLMDLWSLLSVTAPGLFPSAERFEQFYRRPIEREADQERLDQLRKRILPLMLRRTKEQVASDLPAKQEQVLELDLNAKHRKVYQTYLQRERQKVLGLLEDVQRNRFEILKSLTLLRIASLDVALVDEKHQKVPSTKLDHLMEMLEDIVADGHRVIVFSQFTKFLALARERIQAANIDLCYLDGRTRNRPAVIDRFREGDAPVFLISLKAGGFGLNLTEADYCIILDPWWNPATEAQAVDRVHRIGQTKKVMVYRLVAKETIEEKVMALKGKKAALVANVLDGGGFESGAMSASDIRSLLD